MLVKQMALKLFNTPKSRPSPGCVIVGQLVQHFGITDAARKPAHGLDHLIVVHIIEESLGVLVVPKGAKSTLLRFRRKG